MQVHFIAHLQVKNKVTPKTYSNISTRMTFSRAHTYAMATDIAKLLLSNKFQVTNIVPNGVWQCPT